MNLFVLDPDPVKAAWQTCDKHAVKMPLETAQMLCTIARSQGYGVPYKSTHVKHPCTIWAGSSEESFEWTVKHGLGLCETYSARYGRQHASQAVIELVSKLPLVFNRVYAPPFALAMPDKYKVGNAVDSYRNFYMGDKREFATWKSPASRPAWFL